MFWAIFGTIISKVSNAFYAKTAQYEIPAILNELMAYFGALAGLIIILLLGKFNIFLFSWTDYLLIYLSVLMYFVQLSFDKIVYENEKISALIPFQNLGKIISVFMGILILGDEVSFISITLFLISTIVILGSTIDTKSLKFSKYVVYYIGTRILVSIDDIIIGYVLIKNSSLDYFTCFIVFLFVSLFLVTLKNKYFKEIKKLDREYYKSSTISSLGWIAWLITVLMIKELGLSISIILSFLGIGVSLFLSYIMFKDKPSKKNLISTVIVTILITLAFIYS